MDPIGAFWIFSAAARAVVGWLRWVRMQEAKPFETSPGGLGVIWWRSIYSRFLSSVWMRRLSYVLFVTRARWDGCGRRQSRVHCHLAVTATQRRQHGWGKAGENGRHYWNDCTLTPVSESRDASDLVVTLTSVRITTWPPCYNSQIASCDSCLNKFLHD